MNSVSVVMPENTSFSRHVDKHQIAIDSTSLGAAKSCPKLYELSIIMGYTTKHEGIDLRFGSEYHSALEQYDRLRAQGASHEEAEHGAVRHALIRTWDFDLKRPWNSDNTRKNRETLIRTVVWYLEQFEHDPLETVILASGKPAVELSFQIDLADVGIVSQLSGESYRLCGHIDRLVRFAGGVWIVDRKTTKSALDDEYFIRYSPDNQMSLYALAGQVIYGEPISGIIIDAAQVGVGFSRFRRQPIPRTKEQLEEWLFDLRFKLREMEGYAKAGYWPHNDKACNSYISQTNPYGCAFRPICGMIAPLRQKHLDAMYVRRVWDPLQSREI